MFYTLDLYEDLSTPSPDAQPTPVDSQRGALAELSEVYRQWGFESGYAQATRDHLAMFVANAEDILGARGGNWAERDAARRLIYTFIARLERRMGEFGREYGSELNAEGGRPLIEEREFVFADGAGI